MKHLVKIFTLLSFLLPVALVAQDEEPATIKIRKEQDLSKAYFDNTQLKLLVIDRFGNPKENEIMSFKLWLKEPKETRYFEGHDNNLNNDMIAQLNKQKKVIKIFFTEIKARDDEGHLISLPDVIEYWYPNCKNCDPNKKKKRQ